MCFFHFQLFPVSWKKILESSLHFPCGGSLTMVGWYVLWWFVPKHFWIIKWSAQAETINVWCHTSHVWQNHDSLFIGKHPHFPTHQRYDSMLQRLTRKKWTCFFFHQEAGFEHIWTVSTWIWNNYEQIKKFSSRVGLFECDGCAKIDVNRIDASHYLKWIDHCMIHSRKIYDKEWYEENVTQPVKTGPFLFVCM